MMNIGYKKGNSNRTLFVKQTGAKVTILLNYVDVMVIIDDHEEEITNLKEGLADEFDLKDLEKPILGIEFVRSKEGLVMS